ncbi:MAG: hypothetical protein ABSG68_26650, partial [Thermoguttaceae bacterium]
MGTAAWTALLRGLGRRGLPSGAYTLRDESRALAAAAADGTMFVGYWSHELSVENRALPIWSPWAREIPLNAWFADEAARRSFLLIVNEDFDDEPGRGCDAQELDSLPPQRVRQSAASTCVRNCSVATDSARRSIMWRPMGSRMDDAVSPQAHARHSDAGRRCSASA